MEPRRIERLGYKSTPAAEYARQHFGLVLTRRVLTTRLAIEPCRVVQ